MVIEYLSQFSDKKQSKLESKLHSPQDMIKPIDMFDHKTLHKYTNEPEDSTYQIIQPTEYISDNNNDLSLYKPKINKPLFDNKIIKNQYIIPNIEYIKSDYLEKNISNKNYTDLIVSDYIKKGYSEDIRPDEIYYNNTIIPFSPKKPVEEPDIPILAPETAPAHLVADLESRFGKVEFKGKRVMQHPSKHTVHIHTFSYEEDGETREIQAIGKDTLQEEVVVAESLRSVGIPTYHAISTSGNSTFIEYLGDDTAEDILRKGGDSAIFGAISTLGQFHGKSVALETMLDLQHVTPVEMFFNRFMSRIADTSVTTPAQQRLIHAYHQFSTLFGGSGIVHGDSHLRNFVHREQYGDFGIIDFETVGRSRQLLDVSRLVNASQEVIGQSRDFIPEAVFTYLQARDEKIDEHKDIISQLSYVQIADHLLKVGDRLAIAKTQPERATQKEEQAQESLAKAQEQLFRLGLSAEPTARDIIASFRVALDDFLTETNHNLDPAIISA